MLISALTLKKTFYFHNPIRLKTVKNLQRYEKSATFASSKDKNNNIVQHIKSNKIMSTEFFVKLHTPIKRVNSSSLDELRISIDQCRGRYNYAYGSGIKIFFSPIHRERNIFSTTPLGDIVESGFKIHVLDAKRKSQKKIDKVADAIKPLLDKFGEIWGQIDFNRRIANMVIDATEDLRK